MQPLYSVDHETRQNSYRADDNVPAPQEVTPLLHRFPQSNVERSPTMMVAVSLLLILLISGIIIGIYLLVLQSNSENILPPIETPLQLVSRQQWRSIVAGSRVAAAPDDGAALNKAKQVIVVQTDTEPCSNTYSCAEMLQRLQANTTSVDKLLPYNFLVSTNGQTYEALGWHHPPPMFPQYPDSLLLAFIGNFTEAPPSKVQIDEARNFFAESVSQQHLEPSYVVFGKKSAYDPTYLFASLKSLPYWRNDMTDH